MYGWLALFVLLLMCNANAAELIDLLRSVNVNLDTSIVYELANRASQESIEFNELIELRSSVANWHQSEASFECTDLHGSTQLNGGTCSRKLSASVTVVALAQAIGCVAHVHVLLDYVSSIGSSALVLWRHSADTDVEHLLNSYTCLFYSFEPILIRHNDNDHDALYIVGIETRKPDGDAYDANVWLEPLPLSRCKPKQCSAANNLKGEMILGLHALHDASVSMVVDGRAQLLLELERLHDRRYWSPVVDADDDDAFERSWLLPFAVVDNVVGVVGTPFSRVVATQDRAWRFDEAFERVIASRAPGFLERSRVPHHVAHSFEGFAASGKRHALVVSVDGGGSDGALRVSLMERDASDGDRIAMTTLDMPNFNMGLTYALVGTMLPQVAGRSRPPAATQIEFDALVCRALPNWQSVQPLSISGKLMGYSGLGAADEQWVRHFYATFESGALRLPANGERCGQGDGSLRDLLSARVAEPLGIELSADGFVEQEHVARQLAASVQQAFAELLFDLVERWWLAANRGGGGDDEHELDGIVMCGGGALNVLANQMLRERLAVDVFVSPSPSDPGLTVGASLAAGAASVPRGRAPTPFLGMPVWDQRSLFEHVAGRGAVRVDAEQLAHALVERGLIVGIVRGRQEAGPRALGHRSLVAYPSAEAKRKLNVIKAREWWRPVAPLMTLDYAERFFFEPSTSPSVESAYMSFAPRVSAAASEALPSIVHFDGTARAQTLASAADEPFVFALLRAIERRTTHAVVMNTSFNTRGRPLVNRIDHALAMLDDLDDLDAVLVDHFLFVK
jgi:carbamoyltransferase